tara:strand:- start:1463 stop:2677 length:1215 start_codon:yes stop_codon:yes gene_type:complete
VNKNNLLTKNSIPKKYLNLSNLRKLTKKFQSTLKSVKEEINSPFKTLNVLSKEFKYNFKTKDLIRFRKYKTIAIIGMGGSILGTEALYSSLQNRIKKKIYFFNDLNENEISDFKKKEKFSKALFIVVSKSGNTVETLSNAFSLNILKKNSKNIILISEKKNNLLFLLSKKLNLYFIEHKSYLGGRYSVLSEVGIVPAYLMGIKINKLKSKNLDFLNIKNDSFKKDICEIANILSSNKLNNLIFLNYSPELEKFLYWSQQLIAESLGKKNKGFLPVISNVPKDHHSLLQLYLDGPRDKFFYIFSHEKKSKEIIKFHKSLNIKNYLNNKNLSSIKNAQKKALIKAFDEKNIPYREFKINVLNEDVLGKLFSLFIIETVVIGKLLKINPFDQPAVEKVKVYTRKFLS